MSRCPTCGGHVMPKEHWLALKSIHLHGPIFPGVLARHKAGTARDEVIAFLERDGLIRAKGNEGYVVTPAGADALSRFS